MWGSSRIRGKISWGFFDFRGGKAEDFEPEERVVPEPVGHANESPDFLVESLGGGVGHAPGLPVREDAPEVAALPAVLLRGGDSETARHRRPLRTRHPVEST